MKPFIASVLVISFFSVAGFGLATMGHPSMDGGLAACLALLVRGSSCPPDASPLSSLAFHLDAFKIFVTSTATAFPLFALFAALAVLLATALPLALVSSPAQPRSSERDTRSRIEVAPRRIRELCWLSRLETRDSSPI